VSRLVPFVVIGAALAGWEIMARSGVWSPLLFPPLANIG
jgi:ABC-type nitrate/sulfonate/bicarbonate transport system permease component